MMDSTYLNKAIQELRPTAEFSFIENDYSTIRWDKLEGDAPTIEEIEAAIVKIKNIEETEKNTKAAKREAVLSALAEAAGLTVDDILDVLA